MNEVSNVQRMQTLGSVLKFYVDENYGYESNEFMIALMELEDNETLDSDQFRNDDLSDHDEEWFRLIDCYHWSPQRMHGYIAQQEGSFDADVIDAVYEYTTQTIDWQNAEQYKHGVALEAIKLLDAWLLKQELVSEVDENLQRTKTKSKPRSM